jgi:hypothetical protein
MGIEIKQYLNRMPLVVAENANFEVAQSDAREVARVHLYHSAISTIFTVEHLPTADKTG